MTRHFTNSPLITQRITCHDTETGAELALGPFDDVVDEVSIGGEIGGLISDLDKYGGCSCRMAIRFEVDQPTGLIILHQPAGWAQRFGRLLNPGQTYQIYADMFPRWRARAHDNGLIYFEAVLQMYDFTHLGPSALLDTFARNEREMIASRDHARIHTLGRRQQKLSQRMLDQLKPADPGDAR